MKINNQVTLALSIILISISTATAQKPIQQPQENPDSATIQNQPTANKSVFDEIGEVIKSLNRKQ